MLTFLTNIPQPSKEWVEGVSNVAFHIGSLPITWYGIFVTIGFIMAIVFVVIKLACWYKIKLDPFYWFCLMAIPTAILGARFWSCCIGDANWSSFFNFSTGGLAIEGGVVLTTILGLWWFPFILKNPKYQIRDVLTDPKQPAVRQISTWVYVDAILPCILIGQIIGRWGNYFNQELYSAATVTSQSYMNWLSQHLPYMYVNGYYYHPLFLYESCINIVGFLLLYVGLEFIPQIKAGTIGLSYGLWYGIVRMIMEPLRYSQYTFTLTYVMTALWIVVCLILIILNQCKIITKTRKYACKLIIWDSLIFKIKNWFYSWKIRKIELRNKKKDLEKKKYYQTKLESAKEIHQRNKKLYIRDKDHLIFYYGR